MAPVDLFAGLLASALAFQPAPAGPTVPAVSVEPAPCLACVSFRVGGPHVARGPAANIAHNRFSEIQLPGGGYRGFDAHGPHAETRAYSPPTRNSWKWCSDPSSR